MNWQDSIINEPRGAQINQIGVSERVLVVLVLLPMMFTMLITTIGLVYSINSSRDSAQAIAAGKEAVSTAQLAERDAKLAQYQTDVGLTNAGIKHPTDLPPEGETP